MGVGVPGGSNLIHGVRFSVHTASLGRMALNDRSSPVRSWVSEMSLMVESDEQKGPLKQSAKSRKSFVVAVPAVFVTAVASSSTPCALKAPFVRGFTRSIVVLKAEPEALGHLPLRKERRILLKGFCWII